MADSKQKGRTTEVVRRSEMPDWFARWFTDWPVPRWLPAMARTLDETMPFPRVEEYVEDGTAVIRAELPGVDPERDVEITLDDHSLHLRVERRQETRSEETQGQYRTEFSYGSHRRTIPLPAGATEEDVRASYKDGILEVRLPVDEKQADKQKVPIERN